MSARQHVDTERLTELTKALVEICTANPPGHEVAVRDVLMAALKPWGPSWTEVEPAPGRLSLVGRVSVGTKGQPRPTLIVNGHTDVVPVVAERWARPPFRPEVLDGRIYGRGTADMKGGIAAAICALDALEAAGEQPACDIVFHLVADEERGGGLGTRAVLDAGLVQGDACLVPEPTALAVCVAERGLLQGEIVVKGRPAHGSRPREGISAVELGAKIALALHAADFGDADHPLLGKPTTNVGTFHGGTALNIVAEQAAVGFDRRLLPGVDLDGAMAGLRQHLADSGLGDIDYEIRLQDFGEGSEMSPDHPFAELVRQCVQGATGSAPATIGMTFTTDARFVRNQGGVPAVVCGPGDVAQAHGIDEYVAVSQLVDATVAYANLYRSFGPGFLS